MYVGLSARVTLLRRSTGVSIGNGGDENLVRAIRIHANFAEYVPLLLFILWMLEYNVASTGPLWLFGIVIVVGRVLHVYGMWSKETPGWARIAGMTCTHGLLVIGSFYLLYFALT